MQEYLLVGYVGSKQKMTDMDSNLVNRLQLNAELPRWSVSLAEFLVFIVTRYGKSDRP